MRNIVLRMLAAMISLGLGGCGKLIKENGVEYDANKIQVRVSILPQAEWVEKVGGDEVQVEAMIPPGYSPAVYEPTPEQMRGLARAQVYFRVGLIPFERTYMEKLKQVNSEMIVVDTSEGIEYRYLEEHDHGEEEHDGGLDPHVWMSPRLVQDQVEVICQTLVEVRPEREDYFRTNKEEYVAKLKALDEELGRVLAPFEGETMLVYHPAFGYLADDYGLVQRHIEIAGKDPGVAEVQRIVDEARELGVKVVLVQKQFSNRAARVVAEEIGGSVVAVDPLAERYAENMMEVAKTIAESLR